MKSPFGWLLLIFLMIQSLIMMGQPWNNIRHRLITLTPDSTSYCIDSVSIIPNSFHIIRQNGDTLSPSAYHLDPWTSTLSLQESSFPSNDSVWIVVYRVFPILLMKTYRDERWQPEKEMQKEDALSYLYSDEELRSSGQESFLNFGNLEKSGSISRAISVGNNQDAVMNSSMNLQLSGELSPGINIVAAISDNTIPVQPEGSSAQLREFDKVFIRASSSGWSVTAGDFEEINGTGSFLRFNKKVQGLNLQSTYHTGKNDTWKMSSSLSGAITKGRYATQSFNTLEGNLGPYKLRGVNNETFIVVLAGSEKVYLDGKLLQRGEDNDYVIDYNTAQLTFTPGRLITRDLRVVVMFEYTERSYNRSMISFRQQASSGKVSLQLQFFTEQDLKNQPVNQEQLLTENIDMLKDIGDDVSDAVVENVKEVPYSNNEVLYRKTDTLVNGILYTGVYVYSTDPDTARYRVGFSFMGENRGNYLQTAGAVNGKMFRWVAPVNGIPQGDHEPVILLITPKKQQMLTFSGHYQPTPNQKFDFEVALSSLDRNTYSSKDDNDNAGLALATGWHGHYNPFAGDTAWVFHGEVRYRLVNKRFTPIERFKDIEFERDWNITGSGAPSNEHYGVVKTSLVHPGKLSFSYLFEPLMRNSDDYSLRHTTILNFSPGKWLIKNHSSALVSHNLYLPNRFLRHQTSLDRFQGKYRIFLSGEGEDNRQYLPDDTNLFASSASFHRWQAGLERGDSTGWKTSFKVGQRYDMTPEKKSFIAAARADEVWAGMASGNIPGHLFNLNLGYRKLHLWKDLSGEKPEESLLGRAEYHHRFFKGLIRGNLFYEMGSGLEYKKEFTYLEVAPGQGIYTWIDYNGDSIKQIHEFEVAPYQDQALFVRVFTPTSEYEKVYTLQYNQTLHIDPAAISKKETMAGKILSKFSSQGNYRMEQKRGGDDIIKALNPLALLNDDPEIFTLNHILRNTLYFNRSSSRFSLDYTFSRTASKMALVNGTESRTHQIHTLRSRTTLVRHLILNLEGGVGLRQRSYQNFSFNNYRIHLWNTTGELQYQPGNRYRLALKYRYNDKKNTLGSPGEHARLHRMIGEFRYSMPARGSLQTQLEYIAISYNASEQNSIAFEMLEGLRIGNNMTWTIGYQRILASNMQVSFQYNGRKSPATPIVHVGTVQVRAFF